MEEPLGVHPSPPRRLPPSPQRGSSSTSLFPPLVEAFGASSGGNLHGTRGKG